MTSFGETDFYIKWMRFHLKHSTCSFFIDKRFWVVY